MIKEDASANTRSAAASPMCMNRSIDAHRQTLQAQTSGLLAVSCIAWLGLHTEFAFSFGTTCPSSKAGARKIRPAPEATLSTSLNQRLFRNATGSLHSWSGSERCVNLPSDCARRAFGDGIRTNLYPVIVGDVLRSDGELDGDVSVCQFDCCRRAEKYRRDASLSQGGSIARVSPNPQSASIKISATMSVSDA